MAYELKTKPTGAAVDDFVAGVENPQRRADAEVLVKLFAEVSGEPACLWGPSIIGFGAYRYRYESGHEGEMCRIGFSPRRGNLALYINKQFDGAETMVERLGKLKKSTGCLYVTKLSDIDLEALKNLAARSLAHMAQVYPE